MQNDLTRNRVPDGQRVFPLKVGLTAPQDEFVSFFIASYICVLIFTGFVLTSDPLRHWFVIPVMVCGVIIGSDAVDWMRGRMNLFDPAGLLGLLGFHFFFLAPLLHVMWDEWMPYIDPPTDWRPWLGNMAVLNCLGLFIYRFSRGSQHKNILTHIAPRQPIWQVAPKKFTMVVSLALVITGLLQIFVYQHFGGIEGYMSVYTATRESPWEPDGFKGMGLLFTVSESFPILAMMAFVMYARKHKSARSWTILAAALLSLFVLLMLFGGLRGSRSNTLYSLFWGVGMLHLFVRPVSKKILALGLVFFLSFMYLYGFYKGSGSQALTSFEGHASLTDMEHETGRTFHGMLLGDLGRSDVQAFLLYRLWSSPTNYEYAWGRTYIGTAALLVPRAFWPDRPPTKVKEGTEALFGRGSYDTKRLLASNVYGLAGETMLNFGALAVPFAFIVLGLVVKKVRLMLATWDVQDIRRLMIPFLVLLIVHILALDSDNVLWFTVKFSVVPFLVIVTGCNKSFLRSSHLSVSR